jgi:putative ABC transport system permease protein
MNFWMTPYPNPGNKSFVLIFTLVGACVLLLACINFMNLATARYGTRAKEVGMRKVVGARRQDLIKQFIGESCILAVLSLLIAILLVMLFLPAFNQLAGKEMSLDFNGNISLWLGLIGIALVTGLISGSYPSLFLSSLSPTQVFRFITYLKAHRGGRLRKLLVIVQFVFTIGLIVYTTVIYSQLHFIQTKDLGYDAQNIITFAAYGEFRGDFAATRTELLQDPRIITACSAFPPSGGVGQPTIQVGWEGKDPSQEVRFYSDHGDYDFKDTFGLKMAAGRFYSREFPTDLDNFVVNETAVKVMGYSDPIGKRMSFKGKEGTIIGVVKDYHGRSLHEPIRPLVIESGGGFHVCVKYHAGTEPETIAFLEKKWNKYVPGEPFQYGFVDNAIENFYTNERRISKIFRNFTFLAVFIACLGLFGLASFMAERRTKEIGIRKVMGARIWGIILMLSKEFVKWVLLANLIAWPVAYLFSRRWLQGFAYRIDLGWEIFAFSAMLALFIAVLTVSYQAIRAATANPVQSLRYE